MVYNKQMIMPIAVFVVGSILVLAANFAFKDVHVPTLVEAFEILGSEDQKRVLLLWIFALVGVLFQALGTFSLGKVAYTNLFHYSDLNTGGIFVIITIVMGIVTIVSVYYTSLAVMGLLIIAGLFWLWASSGQTSQRRR